MASVMERQTADGFVQAQRLEWDSTATGWRKWWPWMQDGARKADRRFLELVGVRDGDRVLDVGTGLGEPAYSAATLVGDGRVVGVDIAPQMLSLARELAEEGGLSNLEYMEADARSLPFADESFDVVTCRSALMFVPEPGRVVDEIKRVLRPGGRCAVVVPGSPQETPLIGLAFGVIKRMLDLPQPPAGTPGFYALSKPGSVEVLYDGAGLKQEATERVLWITAFESAAHYVAFVQDVAAQVVQLVRKQPQDSQSRIWKQIEAAASAMAGPDRTVSMQNVMVCVTGRK